MNPFLLIAALLLLVDSGWTGGADIAPEVKVESRGEILEMSARITAPYSREEVWRLIGDYESLERYMPNVDSSAIVARTDSSTLVHQVASTDLLLSWTFHLQIEFTEDADGRLRFRMLEGNLRSYEGYWQVETTRDGSQIVYWAQVSHRLPLPNFLARYIARRQMRKMMPALVAELDRKARAGRAAEP